MDSSTCCGAAAAPPGQPSAIRLGHGAKGFRGIVVAVDAKRVAQSDGSTRFEVFTHGGRKATGKDALAWCEEVVQRALNEARGKRNLMDVVETNGPEVETLTREQITAEYYSPHTAKYPPWAIPTHRQWVSDRMDFFVVAYNTGKVKREELPSTYEGFGDPKWKGRLGIEATDQEWLSGMVRLWGSERALGFFRKLVALRPDVRKGHVLLAQLIAAGEIQVGLTA